MLHRVRRLCCAAFAVFATVLTGEIVQAQATSTTARVTALDVEGGELPPGFVGVRGRNGLILQPSYLDGQVMVFHDVGPKLQFEFTPKGGKPRTINLVLEQAPIVHIRLRVDPATGHVKEVVQKPEFPEINPKKKIRHVPGGQQALLVPPNDACGAPTPIGNGATAFSTVDATTDGVSSGCPQANRDIWFDYTATGTGTLTVDTCAGATFDTVLYVYSGLGCPPGAPLGCNDDFCGLQSSTTAAVTAGSHYLIRVGAFGGSTTGTGTITITPPAGVGGFDECAGADDVPCGGSVAFNNAAGTTAGSDPVYSCRVGGAAQGFGTSWFTFSATGSSASLNTEGSTTGDTLLAVYSGTCGALTEIGCDDDSGSGFLSSVTVGGLSIGTTYYVQVAGYGPGNVGNNVLNITCFGAPQGDDCSDPLIGACDSSVTVDLATMTTDPTDPVYSCRFGSPGQGVNTAWITFVATDTSAQVDTFDSTTASDTMIALYEGTCGAFTELCCNDDSGSLLSQFCCEGLTIGNTYYIQLSSFDAFSVGEATLTIECPCPAPPENDECEDAVALGLPPVSVVFDTTNATDDIVVPCGVGSGPFKNVWYSVTGTGNSITATTCNFPLTQHPDTKISVFCGDCMLPVCVGGNDDDLSGNPLCNNAFGAPFLSTVTWCSQPGANYLVTVGGFGPGDFGVVQLDITDDGTPCVPDVQCLPVGACCLPDGSCVTATADECAALGGMYQGDGSACTANAVQDPSFEQSVPIGFAWDSPEWTEFSTNFGSPLCSIGYCGAGGGSGPRTGNIWSWFGGIFAFEEGSIEQSVTIPVGSTTLDFYLEIPVSSGNGVDFMEVLIDGSQVYNALESDGPYLGYALISIPLGLFADGGSHDIEFHSIITGDDGGGGAALTNFFVDDISINTPSIECPQPPGACCLLDGTCVEVTEEDCAALGGTYNGDLTTCDQVDCIQPDGACCLPDGTCMDVTEEGCDLQGGVFQGDFTTCAGVACPQPCFTLDFETSDTGANLVNKQRIDTELDGGPNYPVTLTSSSNVNTCGTVANTAAVYDSDLPPHGSDPDLAVGCGNILILQTDANLNECAPGVFCTGNDDEDGGTLAFAFNDPVEPTSVDLIDVDDSGPDEVVTIVLTDTVGRTRTYTVPVNWTGDLVDDGAGKGTLLLNNTAPQPGFSGSATAVQQAGFDQTSVVSIVITRGDDCPVSEGGSGAIDNLIWCQ